MKKGFTLAEVLITLAIIGVVAAVTIPVLRNEALKNSAIAGIAKAKNTIENANATMLAAEQADSIIDLIGSGEVETVTKRGTVVTENKFDEFYIDKLLEYTKLTKTNMMYKATPTRYNGEIINSSDLLTGCKALSNLALSKVGYISSDGMSYNFHAQDTPRNENTRKPVEQLIGSFVVDVNANKKPNTLGKDIFGFYIYNDGHVKAFGSKNFSPIEDDNKKYNWDNGEAFCNKDGVKSNGLNCTGSIFDNGMKIIYK